MGIYTGQSKASHLTSYTNSTVLPFLCNVSLFHVFVQVNISTVLSLYFSASIVLIFFIAHSFASHIQQYNILVLLFNQRCV